MDLSDDQIAVHDTDSLAEALSLDNGINYIYLESDIELSHGIEIFAGKQSVIIDGFYPLDGTGVIHTLTDMNTTNQNDTIHIASDSSINITFQNMIISGNNYYGVPSISESVQTDDVVVTYRNITYSGPQIIFNPNGTTRFFDSDITIDYPNDQLRMQQVGEVCKVELEGNVTIHHTNNLLSAFWFRGPNDTAYFKVLPNANANITTLGYFMYASYSPLIVNPIAIEIGSGARCTLTTNAGISLDSLHRATSFLVDENASFSYIQTGSTLSTASLYMNGAFTVNQGASVYMQWDVSSSSALIYFRTTSGRLELNNPKSFVLYKNGAAAINFAAQTTCLITAKQLNSWTAATSFPNAGTFLDDPLYKWYKDEYDTFTLNCTVSSILGTNIIYNDFNQGSSISDLQLQNAHVLSAGTPTLNLNPVVDDQTPVNGTADPEAVIRVQYTLDTTDRLIYGDADGEGKFSILTGEELPIGTSVTVSANIPFLIIERSVESEQAGELTLVTAPGIITFVISAVSTQPLLLGRSTPDFTVNVYDSRQYSTAWELVASIDGPLTTASGRSLPDAVVFVEGDSLTPLSSTPISVFSGQANDGTPKTTQCAWNQNEGILLHVTQSIFNSERYSAHMTWSLEVE